MNILKTIKKWIKPKEPQLYKVTKDCGGYPIGTIVWKCNDYDEETLRKVTSGDDDFWHQSIQSMEKVN